MLVDAINKMIGEDWRFRSIKNRIEVIRCDASKTNQYFLDGVFLLALGDVNIESDGRNITASYDYA